MRPHPALASIGSSLFVVYPASPECAGITVEFARIVEGRETITSEITITTVGASEVAWDRINILSSPTRARLAKAADEKSPEAPWRDVLDECCRLVVKTLRAGEPSLVLLPQEPTPEEQCLVPGLIYRNEVNLVFADGGSTKSLFALALAMSGILRRRLSQAWNVGALSRVLYLDWESSPVAHAKRLWGLCCSMERPPDGSILYRRMTRPLTDQLDSIQAECDRMGVDLVICDSLAPASGLEPESGDASIRTLQALRSLNRTSVCLAHMSKSAADGNAEPRVYGSVFNGNLARSTIQIRPDDPGHASRRVVTFIHRKVNDGPYMPPSSLVWDFLPTGAIQVGPAPVSIEYLSLKDRIEHALRDGNKTVGVISEELTAKYGSVKAALNEMQTVGRALRFSENGGGRAHKSLWGLPLINRSGQ